MQVYINGEAQNFDGGATVAQLVEKLALDMKKVAVEINRVIVPRSAYGEKRLCEGDAIEIVRFIGGG